MYKLHIPSTMYMNINDFVFHVYYYLADYF